MAQRSIVISERDNIAALFEEKQALEFIIHRGDMLLGDVYLAEVENILPSIDAAFVNVGGGKMGFLHSSDVQGKGDLKTRLKPKQKLVVQVIKEPTGHKGPRVTTNISLPGRFLVLMPESKGISVSRRIEDPEQRSRLKSTVSLMKPSGVGIIIRTEADGQTDSDIQEDFEILLERWQTIVSTADSAKPPTLLYRDQDLLYRVIRESVNEGVGELIVDTPFGFQRAQQLLQTWNLDKQIKLSLHNGKNSIMVDRGVEREIKLALQTKVPLPSGGYLYIQPTEALTVVDVNSGKFTSLQSQAETIRITNLEASKEIARQLRLRNIGGMVVVDFIDMESRADQLSILVAFEKELAKDKGKPQMGQLTDLGLVEMTRHRQGQALSEIFGRSCGACHGTGHVIQHFHWASSSADAPSQDRSRKFGSRYNRNEKQEESTHTRLNPPVKPGDVERDLHHKKNQPKRPRVMAQPSKKEDEKPVVEEEVQHPPIQDWALQWLLDTFAIRLAHGIKMSQTPPRANQALGRLNPAARDLFTLIDSLHEVDEPQEEKLAPGALLEAKNPSELFESTLSSAPSRPSGSASLAPVPNPFGDESVNSQPRNTEEPEAVSPHAESEEEATVDAEQPNEEEAPRRRSPRGRRPASRGRRSATSADTSEDSPIEEVQAEQATAVEESSAEPSESLPPAVAESTVVDEERTPEGDDPQAEVTEGDGEEEAKKPAPRRRKRAAPRGPARRSTAKKPTEAPF